MLKLIKTTIEIGLEKPVKLLHVTDTHLTLCDDRDNERKQKLAAARTREFGDVNGSIVANLNEQIAYAEAHCDLLVHTGDLIDFVSTANVAMARALLKYENVFFIAGNHEYSQYVGEAWEDAAYRMNSYMQMGFGLGVDMFFNARQVGGVNLVAMDNGYYLFEDWQLWRLRREVEKGLPVVLCIHDPLFEPSLYESIMSKPGATSAGIVGCDEDRLLRYSEFRAVQQRPDEPTLRMIDYIEHEPRIKAVLAGHLHFNYESRLAGGQMQYITGGGYEGVAREVTIV